MPLIKYKTTINYYKIIFITSKKIIIKIKINFLYLWKIFKKLHIGSLMPSSAPSTPPSSTRTSFVASWTSSTPTMTASFP